MKKLSILIPRYKEDESIVCYLLDSIKVQQAIDFNDIEVVIAQDGLEQEPLSQEFINSYKDRFDIRYVKFEHGGISATRNHLLDISCGEYVQFCDDDDMFSSVLGLKIILDKINNGGFEALFSTFTEEYYNKDLNKRFFVLHENDCIFVHGKVFNKQFLIDNNIRFKNEIKFHEDVYFIAQCYHCSNPNKRVFITTPFYIWKWRDGSVVRSDQKWLMNTYHILLDSNESLVENFLERGMIEQVEMFSFIVTFNMYYKINLPQYCLPENKERVLEIERRFKKFYVKYVDYMDKMPADKQQRFIASLRDKAVAEGLMLEHITFEDWIKHILEL